MRVILTLLTLVLGGTADLFAGSAERPNILFIVTDQQFADAMSCRMGSHYIRTPQMEGRMVRSERFKYCVFSRGERRESLVDMEADPGEMSDLAAEPKYREVLLHHRELLAQFGRKHADPLVAELLADGVKPAPFPVATPSGNAPKG